MSQNSSLVPWYFPNELSESSSLVTLNLGSSNVVGSIPDIFDFLPNLQDLMLSHNYLTGSLPPSFAGTGIRSLQLNNQKWQLSGPINVLSNMTQLHQVWLSGNWFNGSIPDLSKLDTLFDLQLRDNVFTGVVPSSLMSISSLRNVSLTNNRLQGPRPSFPSSVTDVDLNGTNSFCRDTEGPCDLQVATLLEVAGDLGYPLILASSWLGNDACKGWRFVGCDLQGNHLRLNDNTLTGPIPDSLTHLPQLRLLNVSYNNLTREIPKFQSSVSLATSGNLLLGNTPSSGSGETSSNGNRVSAGYPAGGGGKSRLRAAIAATAAAIGVLVILLFYLRKFASNILTFYRRKQTPVHGSIEAFLRNCGPLQVRRYSYLDVVERSKILYQVACVRICVTSTA
ncbi:LRR domain containing protein [Parasponia andersonii]|uniref:LRR domain containing protein n=1 Tax=Parasponia andersonii TaxID=3476 RepID=A0A2P5DZH2_PARAD|nr:LRR domain containing protein [Parasponia andersonii]